MSMLMLPMIVTFIPLFVLTARMGLVNTYAGMILPYLVTPLGVFLMRQFISGLPDEIIEAGRMDGAGELRIFASLIMPLTGPALATLTILTFLGPWNNFLWPLVIAQTQRMHTLPVALAAITTGPRGTDFALTMAGATIVVIPVVIVYIAMQRYFTQGIANTGIK
jgi:multiple sugar transport system permease protein